jgi:hypothetical protein
MFSRWFKKGNTPNNKPTGTKTVDESPLQNQNQIQIIKNRQDQQFKEQQQQQQQQLTQKTQSKTLSTTQTTRINNDQDKNGPKLSSTKIEKSPQTASSTSLTHKIQQNIPNSHNITLFTKQELESMPVAMKNKVKQLQQWLHDINILQQRLVTYSNVLIDLSRAGIDISSAGKTIEQNKDVFNEQNNNDNEDNNDENNNNIKITPEHIAAFEAFHFSIELATKQALSPILFNNNDSLLNLSQQPNDTTCHRAAQHVTTFHQQFDPSYFQIGGNFGGNNNNNNHNNNHHFHNNDDNMSVAALTNYTNTTHQSIAPTRRTYRQSRLPQTQFQGQNQQNNIINQNFTQINSRDAVNNLPMFPASQHHIIGTSHSIYNNGGNFIVQPPRAQLPSSSEAQKLQNTLMTWTDGMFFQLCFLVFFFV